MSQSYSETEKPWYRQFWFWFVMAPLIVVVPASFGLLATAIIHSDDRVIDNYYKHGRMINQSLEQDARARLWGVSARLQLKEGEVALQLETTTTYPTELSLWLDHPFEEKLDHFIQLERGEDGIYRGELPVQAGSWYATLAPEVAQHERAEAPWRLRGELTLTAVDTEQTFEWQPPGL